MKATMSDWNTPDYNRLVSRRPSHILSLLRSGHHVLYADIDSVWKSSPLTYWDNTVDLMYGIDVVNKEQSLLDNIWPTASWKAFMTTGRTRVDIRCVGVV